MFTKAEEIKKENESYRERERNNRINEVTKQIQNAMTQMKAEHRDVITVPEISSEFDLYPEIAVDLKENGWYFKLTNEGLQLSVTEL